MLARDNGVVRKVWFAVVRSNGRQTRVTIGTYPAISLAEARDQARKVIRNAQLGVVEQPAEPAALTFGETVPRFIRLYAKPKNRGWKESESLLGKFQALSAKPLDGIRRSDVVRILDDVVACGSTEPNVP
jgi:hypothetical protein